MILYRDFTKYINWIFDNLIPPVLRDSKWFMYMAFFPLFGRKTKYFMHFKEKAWSFSDEEFRGYYILLADKHIKRETDINEKSLKMILENIEGEKILDVACGRGYLVNLLAGNFPEKSVYGVDIIIPKMINTPFNTHFKAGNVEKIEFPDNFFDTVICTHTLEHVQDINQAVKELRRVCKSRLIIIVPRQREYRYTYDLHLHFFPYIFSIQKLMKNPEAFCKIVGNDIFYMENKSNL